MNGRSQRQDDRRVRAAGPGGPWRAVGATFLAGALLDLPFGAAVLLAPGPLAPLLGVTLPGGHARVYFDLNGLLLLALGTVYVLVWRAPRRFAPVAAVAGVLRLGGFVLFSAAVALGRADRFFLLIGATEGVLGIAHLGLLARARRADARMQGAGNPARSAEAGAPRAGDTLP